MKIFGNCLVKNEADMIVETLVHAARWCDHMFVFDNGSTDGTRENVLDLARRRSRGRLRRGAAVAEMHPADVRARPVPAADPVRAERILAVISLLPSRQPARAHWDALRGWLRRTAYADAIGPTLQHLSPALAPVLAA